MDPDYKPEYVPSRNSTLFTKKHTKGRLNFYNKYLFSVQKNTNKYILPAKPEFWSWAFWRYDTTVLPDGVGFTTSLI